MKKHYLFLAVFLLILYTLPLYSQSEEEIVFTEENLEITDVDFIEDTIENSEEDLIVDSMDGETSVEESEEKDKGYVYYFWEELKEQFRYAGEDEEIVKSYFTCGPILLTNEFKTTGLGLSGEYEHQIIPHFSLKARSRLTTFLTGYSDLTCLTAYSSIFAEYYPMSRQLRKLYVGIGGAIEGYVYINGIEEIEGSDQAGWIFSVTPEVGYKFRTAHGIVFDMYVGYKWTYPIESYFYGAAIDFFGNNLVYGVNVHLPIKYGKLFFDPYKKARGKE